MKKIWPCLWRDGRKVKLFFVLNLNTKLWLVASFMTRPLYPQERTSVFIEQKTGWAEKAF